MQVVSWEYRLKNGRFSHVWLPEGYLAIGNPSSANDCNKYVWNDVLSLFFASFGRVSLCFIRSPRLWFCERTLLETTNGCSCWFRMCCCLKISHPIWWCVEPAVDPHICCLHYMENRQCCVPYVPCKNWVHLWKPMVDHNFPSCHFMVHHFLTHGHAASCC